jgi:hypothetical protein
MSSRAGGTARKYLSRPCGSNRNIVIPGVTKAGPPSDTRKFRKPSGIIRSGLVRCVNPMLRGVPVAILRRASAALRLARDLSCVSVDAIPAGRIRWPFCVPKLSQYFAGFLRHHFGRLLLHARECPTFAADPRQHHDANQQSGKAASAALGFIASVDPEAARRVATANQDCTSQIFLIVSVDEIARLLASK